MSPHVEADGRQRAAARRGEMTSQLPSASRLRSRHAPSEWAFYTGAPLPIGRSKDWHAESQPDAQILSLQPMGERGRAAAPSVRLS